MREISVKISFIERMLCMVNQGFFGEAWEEIKKVQMRFGNEMYILLAINWGNNNE